MAGKLISDLNSVVNLGLADAMEIDKEVSGARTSYKTTVKEIVDFANQNIADEYDSTSSYAVGDYVMYESVLYKCTGATTGSFDSTKWTAVVVTDEMGSGGGGGGAGHTILDDSGTALAQEDSLQIKGVYSHDDNTNDKTVVEVYREMTKAEFDLLSAAEKKGFIKTTDEPDIASVVDGVFIDPNSVIKNDFTFDGTGHTWTATEDCIIAGNLVAIDAYTGAYVWVDNITCFNCYEATSGNGFCIPVKKGQIVTYRAKTSATNNKMSAYGIQQGSKVIKYNYSTEEQIVGTWIDGSTLYQKVFDLGSDVNFSSTQWTTSGVTIPNLDKIIEAKSTNSGGTSYPLMAYHTNGAVNLLACRDGQPASSRWLILEYTKTS